MSTPTRTRTTTEQAPSTPSTWTTVTCPDCGQPAEILDSFTLSSTSGPMPHLRIACAARHHFMLPAEYTDLPVAVPTRR